MDPNQDTSVDQEHSHVRSWRPPTPPPPPTTTTISSLTDKIMDEQKKTPWGVKTFFKKDNQHHHNKLEQNHSDDDDDDDDSNIHFRSTDTADIFDQEPMDSLLLTEEGKDDDDDDHNYNNSNLTQTSTMTNNLLQGTTKKKTTLFENLQRKQRPQTKDSPPEDDQLSTKYQMMKSQHGIISSTLTSSFDEEQQHDVSFFYNGMDDLEVTRYRQERNATNWNHARNLQQESTNYFDHSLRRDFVQAHAFLNAFIANENNSINDDDDDDNDEETFDDNDDYMDFSTLFSFGCSPSSRQRHVDSEKDNRLPAIADIRKSSLSYFHKGRVQMRLPTDHIRLAMDEYLEPGILIVERPLMQSEMDPTSRTHVDQRNGSLSDENTSDAHMPLLENSHQDDEVIQSDTIRSMRNTDTNMNVKLPLLGDDQDDIEQQNLEPLNYILTVDQNIYKRLLADISSSRMPCGFYYCCHDTVDHSKNVHIGVAIAILSVVFTFLFVATCIWPLD